MLKPEIIGSLRSTYTRVVRMVCEEKGIEYVLEEAELGAPEIFAIHPFGKMPVMRHPARRDARQRVDAYLRSAALFLSPVLDPCASAC